MLYLWNLLVIVDDFMLSKSPFFNHIIIHLFDLTSSLLGDMLESSLRFITSQSSTKACNTLTLLLQFINTMNENDKKLSLQYCLKGEFSIWNRLQSHNQREKIKVCIEDDDEN